MRKINRKSPLDFILPFLILVSIGVIGVLGYQLWQNYTVQGKANVYFYIVEGKAKLLPYGKSEWENAYSGTKLLLGDSVKTSAQGKLVMSFYNDSIVRLNSDSAVTLTDLVKQFDSEKIVLNLNNGVIWVKAGRSQDVRESQYEVRMSHLKVKSSGATFELEDADAETVRVFDKQVDVDILVNESGKERVADTITVGVGQELVLDEAALKAFKSNNRPSLLKAISDQFKATDWYVWNMKEDNSPTDFDNLDSAISENQKIKTIAVDSGDVSQEIGANVGIMVLHEERKPQTVQTSEDNSMVEESFIAPVIDKPLPSERTVKTGGKLTISGSVGLNTAKVVVEQTSDGVKDVYVLSKYVKGTKGWSYNVSELLGNLKPGENIYDFYAVDEKGNKSGTTQLIINYDKVAPEIKDDLEAPKPLTFNGSTSSDVKVGIVKIEGIVKGAEKVVVNGYTLSKFIPGDTKWIYTANESYGNFNAGINEFEAYALAPDGTKSDVSRFTVNYDKPVIQPKDVSGF